jgi:hypothetical protein
MVSKKMTDIQFSHLVELICAVGAVLAFGVGYLGGHAS